MIASPVAYEILRVMTPGIAFLNRMAISMGIVILVMSVITALKPLAQPVEIQVNHSISLEPSKTARNIGLVIVALTLLLYAIFW